MKPLRFLWLVLSVGLGLALCGLGLWGLAPANAEGARSNVPPPANFWQPLTGPALPPPTILNAAAVGRGALNQPFTYTFETTGTLPITVSTSALPAGLSLSLLDATHALITGTPLTAGSTNLTLQAQNSVSATARGVVISITTVPLTPLVDLAGGYYLGQFAGGLYSGTNTLPSAHAQAGQAQAARIQPRDISGNLTSTGQYVLLSIGMSNASQEFCHQNPNLTACHAWSFAGQAAADGAVNHSTLVILNGARGGQDVTQWLYPTMTEYSRIQNQVLAANGYSETQVQAVWLKQSNVLSSTSPRLPSPQADAYVLLQRLGHTVRALKVRYPNLQMVFFSSRTYGGFGYSESQSYEVGFALQWLIQAQIRQMATGIVDPIAGDLDYTTVAPWLGWSAYLWADGWHPNREGLWWEPQDFESDFTHPSTLGETKVGARLLNFFKTSPLTACWFLAGGACQVNYFNYLPMVTR